MELCKFVPMPALDAMLDALPEPTKRLLDEHHFDRSRFLRLAAGVCAGARSNQVSGALAPPEPGDVLSPPEPGSARWQELEAWGLEALAQGEVALVVLAGGMATRMGGVVKALVEALPGETFLDLRLGEMRALAERVGRPVPLWLMTSLATRQPIERALAGRLDDELLAVFPQHVSLRLTPTGELFLDGEGHPSLQASGHGDLPDALRDSGLLSRFVDRGGTTLLVTNLDNLGATLDPVLIGLHLEHGLPVTCEVVDKADGDRGGIPVRLDGRAVVLEEFRIPPSFDPSTVRVFNTNTFHFDARRLLDLRADWSFFTVEKKVNSSMVVQFERLLGEITSFLETRFVRVPRQGAQSRFLPVKDEAELLARRSEIEVVARGRGMSS